jgi:hypothetical protein
LKPLAASRSRRKFEKQGGTVTGLQTSRQMPKDLILAKGQMIKATAAKERASKDEEGSR